MADTVIPMETGTATIVSNPRAPGVKVRKFPDVPEELLERARVLEAEKYALASIRGAAKDVLDPSLRAQTKELRNELSDLWATIRATQSTAMTARIAKERLKQSEAAERAAARRGNAD